MDTSYMREFLVLAKHLNYTTAAQALYISQPTLSRHISSLEDELGVRLLNRTRHSVSLTPSGEAAVASFSSIVQHCDELINQIGKLSYENITGLRLGMIYFGLSSFYGNALIEAFAVRNPEIHISTITSQADRVFENLENGAIDLAIAITSPVFEDDFINKIVIESIPMYAIVKKGHEWSTKKSVTIEDLATVPLIASRHSVEKMSYLEEVFKARGFKYKSLEYTSRIDALMVALNSTDKIHIGTKLISVIPDHDLVFIPIDSPDFYEDVSLLYIEGNTSPNIPKFINCIDLVPKPSELSSK